MGAHYSIHAFKNRGSKEVTETYQLDRDFRGELFGELHSQPAWDIAAKYNLSQRDIFFFYRIDVSPYYGEEEDSSAPSSFEAVEVADGIQKLTQKLDPKFYEEWREHFEGMSQFIKSCAEKQYLVQIVAG